MKLSSVCLALLTTASILCVPAAQAVLAVSKNFASPVSIPGLTGFASTGADMDGLKVTATFSNGLIQTLTWADTGATSGGVSGTGWGLSLDGDTFNSPWDFDFFSGNFNLGRLVSLVLDATAPGQVTVFDTTQPSPGTDGSGNGTNFNILSGCGSCNGTVVYYQPIGIGAAAPVGDIFHKLVLTFDTGTGPRSDWSFGQDTDNDVRINIPEPGTLALAGLALTGLFAASRRRRA